MQVMQLEHPKIAPVSWSSDFSVASRACWTSPRTCDEFKDMKKWLNIEKNIGNHFHIFEKHRKPFEKHRKPLCLAFWCILGVPQSSSTSTVFEYRKTFTLIPIQWNDDFCWIPGGDVETYMRRQRETSLLGPAHTKKCCCFVKFGGKIKPSLEQI